MGYKQYSEKTKKRINIVIIVTLLITASAFIGRYVLAPLLIGGEETTTTTTLTTFDIFDDTTDYEVSHLCRGSVLVNNTIIDPTDKDEIYDPANYKTLESSNVINTISVDMRLYSHGWLKIVRDTSEESYWPETYIPIQGLMNTQNTYYLSHLPGSIHGSMLNITDGQVFSGFTNGTYRTLFWFGNSTDELHWNTNDDWDTKGDWADLTTATKDKLYDQNMNRAYMPRYSLANDTIRRYDRRWEKITATFAIELDFNDTISTTDLALTQVNISIVNDVYFDILYGYGSNADKMYIAAYYAFNCISGPKMIDINISMGNNISVSKVNLVDLLMPGDYQSAEVNYLIENII